MTEHNLKIITFANRKGGVTKTTTTQNVAILLANQGFKVLVVDLDSQGNLSTVFGLNELKTKKHTVKDLFIPTYDRHDSDDIKRQAVKNTIYPTSIENLDIIPSNDTLVGVPNQIINDVNRERHLNDTLPFVANDYNFILIDTSPNLDVIFLNADYISDGIIVPVQTDELAYKQFQQFVENLTDLHEDLFNDPNDHIMGTLATLFQKNSLSDRQVRKMLLDDKHELITTIKKSVRVKNGVGSGQAIVQSEPTGDITMAYQQVADFIVNTLPDNKKEN